jgi:hypothetical protein
MIPYKVRVLPANRRDRPLDKGEGQFTSTDRYAGGAFTRILSSGYVLHVQPIRTSFSLSTC